MKKLELEHRWLKNAYLNVYEFPAVFATQFLWFKLNYSFRERERERERESCSGSRSEEVEKKLMQLIDGGGGVLESGRLSRSLRMPRTLFQNAVKITYA